MKVKRLVASLGASFEEFVNLVENHEAVAESAIRDVRDAAAKVKVQINGVTAQADRLGKRRETLAEDVERWRERAKRFAGEDKDRALECLRRMERAKAEEARVADQLSRHEALGDRLKERLATIEARLAELQLKKTDLSGRSACTQVRETADQETSADVDSVFERWEMAVVKDEYLGDVITSDHDRLERELDSEEEQQRLEILLEELKKEEER